MPPEEFALWLSGLIVVALMISIFVSAQSNNPQKMLVITLAISCIMVIVVSMVGLMCYAVAWLLRNPTVLGILVIASFLIYLRFRPDVLSQGEEKK